MSSNSILVVDDDSAILELIAQVLTDEGYSVIAAGDGRTAVELARAKRPRLILLDLMMPEMNGWQVIAKLQESPPTRKIPVILLSARRDLAQSAADLGATAYIEKPFDLDDLLECVQRYVTLNGFHNEKETTS
jgi:CheY-like chemotaxis protein